MNKLHLVTDTSLEFVKNLILVELVDNTRQACIGTLKRHDVSLDANIKYCTKTCLESLIRKIACMFGCSGYELMALLKMTDYISSTTTVEYNKTAYRVRVEFHYNMDCNGIIVGIDSNDLKHVSSYRLTTDKDEDYKTKIEIL